MVLSIPVESTPVPVTPPTAIAEDEAPIAAAPSEMDEIAALFAPAVEPAAHPDALAAPLPHPGEIARPEPSFVSDMFAWAPVTPPVDAPATEARLDQAPVDQSVADPVVHDLSLPNGVGFQTRLEDGVWVTRVTATSDEASLVEGDILIGLVRTNQRVDGPEALARIIDSEMAEGRHGMAFAVERDGQMWVETLVMPSL